MNYFSRVVSSAALLSIFSIPCLADTLFDGSDLARWEFRKGGWVIEEDGSMKCEMEAEPINRKGKPFRRPMGYIWTKESYGDFVLELSYKLSKGANSGIFFRTDRDNPVQGGFEIQLMDNAGFQKAKGKELPPRRLNGALYDARAPSTDPAHPVGEWNTLKLTCKGSKCSLEINGKKVFDVDLARWDTAGKNPDGSTNKFKTALKDLPGEGRIGFQNHGQVVWFKDVSITEPAGATR